MIDYGIVQSTVTPDNLVIDDNSVWVNSDITPVEKDDFIGVEYQQKRYTKNEYIKLISEAQDSIISSLIDLVV